MSRFLRNTWKKDIRPYADLWLIFLIGAMLRVGYTAATPLEIRSYDWHGHLEYLTYVLQEWRIPFDSMGWEMHQAPLYYFVAAGVHLLFSGESLRGLQLFSLFLSVMTL